MAIIGVSGKIGSGKDTVGSIIQYLIEYNSCKYMHPINEKDFNDYIKNNHKSNWKIVKFADKIKNIVCLLIGCSIKQLEDRKFKEKELEEEWWYWKLERECGYSTMMLDYLNTSKEKLKNYKGLILVKTTPRLLLQLLGTECGRKIIHPNIWVNSLMNDIDKQLNNSIVDVVKYKPDYVYSEPIFIKPLEGKYNLYKCCCGKEFKADKYKIKTKHTKSCGCYQKYKAGLTQFKDGRKGTRLWSIYNNMIQRCENKNHPRYLDYGKRGIIVSDEFKPFKNFKKWALSNGYSDDLSLDRIDNNDVYCPDNCKFSSDFEQVINTRDRKDNTSGYRGVSKDKHNWRATIQIQSKQKFLGYFNTAEEASIAYEKAFLERKSLYTKQSIKKGFIITDLRFENELKAIKDRDGIIIRVNRPILNETAYKKAYRETHEHESENSLDSAIFDYVIDNNSDISSLIEKVREILVKANILKLLDNE